MTKKWFVRRRTFFHPVSVTGWFMFSAAIVCCIFLFINIDSHSHSASDTLRNFVFNALIIFAVYAVIAYFTSNKEI